MVGIAETISPVGSDIIPIPGNEVCVSVRVSGLSLFVVRDDEATMIVVSDDEAVIIVVRDDEAIVATVISVVSGIEVREGSIIVFPVE